MRVLGEALHLVSHHREAASAVAGRDRLHGSGQREHRGAFRDFFNDGHSGRNLPRNIGQAPHADFGLLDLVARFIDAVDRFAHDFQGIAGGAKRLLGFLPGKLCLFTDLTQRLRGIHQFLRCGVRFRARFAGEVLHFVGARTDTLRTVGHHFGNRIHAHQCGCGGAGHHVDGVRNRAGHVFRHRHLHIEVALRKLGDRHHDLDHRVVELIVFFLGAREFGHLVVEHAVESLGKLADFVGGLQARAGVQIAGADLLHGLLHLRERQIDRARQAQTREQCDQADQQQRAEAGDGDTALQRSDGRVGFRCIDFRQDHPAQAEHVERRIGSQHVNAAIVGIHRCACFSGQCVLYAAGLDAHQTDVGIARVHRRQLVLRKAETTHHLHEAAAVFLHEARDRARRLVGPDKIGFARCAQTDFLPFLAEGHDLIHAIDRQLHDEDADRPAVFDDGCADERRLVVVGRPIGRIVGDQHVVGVLCRHRFVVSLAKSALRPWTVAQTGGEIEFFEVGVHDEAGLGIDEEEIVEAVILYQFFRIVVNARMHRAVGRAVGALLQFILFAQRILVGGDVGVLRCKRLRRKLRYKLGDVVTRTGVARRVLLAKFIAVIRGQRGFGLLQIRAGGHLRLGDGGFAQRLTHFAGAGHGLHQVADVVEVRFDLLLLAGADRCHLIVGALVQRGCRLAAGVIAQRQRKQQQRDQRQRHDTDGEAPADTAEKRRIGACHDDVLSGAIAPDGSASDDAAGA